MLEAAGSAQSPIVIKIGGSLAETRRLRAVINLLERASVPIVVVPGGGPFADAVRSHQQALGYSDPAAHRMAMLAMAQMAEVLQEMSPRLKCAETLPDIRLSLAEGKYPVWLPLQLAGSDPLLPQDWTVTSDALAARLAELLVTRLILLKSVAVDQDSGARELANAGTVDQHFPIVIERARIPWRIYGPAEDDDLAADLGCATIR